MLSTALAGCGHAERPASPGEIVAVKVENTPSPDLLACPELPTALPTDIVAQIPRSLRDGIGDLALAYRDTRAQLVRLIRWHMPGACEGDAPE